MGVEVGILDACLACAGPGVNVLDAIRDVLIREAWVRCDFVQKDAADLLGVHRRVMNYRLETMGLRPKDLKASGVDDA